MNIKTTLSVVVLSLGFVACKDRDDATGYADASLDKSRIEDRADRAKDSIEIQAKAEKAKVEAQSELAKSQADARQAEAKAQLKATDKSIDAELKVVFASKDTWNDVNASFDNGIVTLKGNVPSDADRTEIANKVKAMSGVTAVRNELEVK